VFSPLHDVGVGGDEVAKPDLEGLEGCSAVLALLDEIDVGTSVEIGWAAAKGIPVVGYSSRPADDAWKMVRGTGGTVVDDLSTAVYRAVWATP
jgi:nucleoside 2-deoxyribosyltransferase